MLMLFVLASIVVVTALTLATLDVFRMPQRVVGLLLFVFFLLILLGVAWVGMLVLGSG